MITLETLNPRVLQVLEDPAGNRFDDATLAEAARQTLDRLDEFLPNLSVCTVTAAAGGRDQPLPGLENCLYLVNVCLNLCAASGCELEPESGFSYQFHDGQPWLHFNGRAIPRAGDTLRVTYAARHSLSGLDGAATTSVPEPCSSALVNGAAGMACRLRAGLLAEAYGTRPEESTRLLELARLYLDRFEASIQQVKTLQEFGFPPGFALDEADHRVQRCANG